MDPSSSSTLLVLSLFLLSCHAYNISIHQPELIRMGSEGNASIFVYLDGNDDRPVLSRGVELTLNFTDDSSWSSEFHDSNVLTFEPHEIRRNTTKNITLSGVIIGIRQIQISSRPVGSGGGRGRVHEEEIEVKIIVASRLLNNIFVGVITTMVLINTINMGGQLDLEVIKKVFKKPIGPGVGFLCQFLIMPLLSFGIGWLMFDNLLYRFGLFILGTCPGGTGSNFWCILLGGDLNLSITMTFISTIAAMGMMPLWVGILGPYLVDGLIRIPYQQIVITLLSLIIPVVIGMLIRNKSKKAGQLMAKVIVPCTILLVFFISTFGIWMNWFIFQLLTGALVAAGFMVAVSGYLLGAGFAWAFRLELPQIIAVAIETTFQNAGIAFVLLKLSLDEPYGDLASIAPVGQLVVTGLPLWGVLLIKKTYERCKKKTDKEEAIHERVPTEDPEQQIPDKSQSISNVD